MRCVGDASDESSGGDRDRAVWIKISAAVHPPCARQDQREPIRHIGVRRAHVAGIPFHQNEIGPGLVQASIEDRHLTAVRWGTAPGGPLDSIVKSYLSLRRIN